MRLHLRSTALAALTRSMRASRRAGFVAGLISVAVSLTGAAGAGAAPDPVGVKTDTVCAATKPAATGSGVGCVDSWSYTGSAQKLNAIDTAVAAGAKSFLVYTPGNWTPSEHLPVYVMLHGCNTTAAEQMGANLLNPLADRERFIVVYPDNGGVCWPGVSEDSILGSAYDDSNITRGGGGAADAIAEITQKVVSDYHADSERVYLAGMSSGAFQTSATAAAYPDVFAAAGENAGAGYGMSVLGCGGQTVSVPAYARTAVEAMGSRARVMPFFAIGGTQDPLGNTGGAGGCVRLAYQEWLYTNNLLVAAAGDAAPGACSLVEESQSTSDTVVPGVPTTPDPGTCADTFRPDPASTTKGQVPGGYSWTEHVARGPHGCEIGENWTVDGMGHFWSGGSSDPQWAEWTDPKGPSASELSWKFFVNRN